MLYFPLAVFTAIFGFLAFGNFVPYQYLGVLLEQQPTLLAFYFFLTVLLSALFALGAVFLFKYLRKKTLNLVTRKKTKPKSSQLKHFRADFIFVIAPLMVFIAICSVYATYYTFSRVFYSISAKEVISLIIGVWTTFWSLLLLKVYVSLRK